MKIFNTILGIFSILGSIYCIFYPGLTFLNSGWILTILLGAWGFCAIFDCFSDKNEENRSKGKAAIGGVGLAFGIAAAIFSTLCMFMPRLTLVADIVILAGFCSWLLISGIGSIAAAFAAKKLEVNLWWLSLILGIIVTIAGIYGFFHMIFAAQTIGMLIGIYLMGYGIRLILSIFESAK